MRIQKFTVGSAFLLIFTVGISSTVYAETMEAQLNESSRELSSSLDFAISGIENARSAYENTKIKDELEKVKKAKEAELHRRALGKALKKERERRRQKRRNNLNDRLNKAIAESRKKGVNENNTELTKSGKLKATDFPRIARNIKTKNFGGNKLTVAQVRKAFLPGVPFNKLTSEQRKAVLENYNWLLKNKVTLAFLIAVIRAEGSPSPKTVLGYLKTVGYKYKSAECQEKIGKLDLSNHAKEQHLPQRCFSKTVKSSAFGYFQIVYKTLKTLKNLGFNNYSRKTQARCALELVRRSPGTAEAFIAIAQAGNNDRKKLDFAIKKGTQEWASGYSSLPGKKAPILTYARQELKKLQSPKKLQNPKELKDKSYYQAWLDEFNDDNTL